ncbi:MAG TPA: hypothetical protein VK206_25430 [Anaerolineales bacterium]|nr:hypothetical protein [Anaerolineales bacterium]
MLSKYQRFILLIILIMVFAIQGCGASVQVTSSEMMSTATETIMTGATDTPSPKPYATYTATLDAVATANFVETASVGTLIAMVRPTVIATYPSGDGKWRLEVIRYDCAYVYHNYNEAIAYEQLRLINLREGTEKIVADQWQNCEGLGAFGFNGLYWSPKDRYFYYNESREGYPDGGCGNYIPLIYRLDPVNQEVITLAGGFISPDKTKLAMWQGHEIVIWDLDKSEIARVISLYPYLFNGTIWWSGKDNSIVYLQTESECAPNLGKSYLVSLDLANHSQNLITEYEVTSRGFVSTPAPVGVFVFYFYSPLIMQYDPSIWEIKNGLQARQLTSCSINEQGPMDFNGPHTSGFVQLGDIRYEVLSFSDSSSDYVSRIFLADQAHATEAGLPVFWVSAKSDEWNKCRTLAEQVLATLHFPP